MLKQLLDLVVDSIKKTKIFIVLLFSIVFLIEFQASWSKVLVINILHPAVRVGPSSIAALSKLPTEPESISDSSPIDQATESDVSSYEEREMGKAFMSYIRNSLPLVHDAIINDYINALGYQLVAASPRPSQPYYFFVIRQKDINAFSGPDGYIGIYAGLIAETRTKGELAAVLAHEIAHVSQHHIAQMVREAKTTQMTSLGALVAAIALGVANPLAGISAASIAGAGSSQHLINFTRYHEAEADRIAIQILAKAGFDPRNLPQFFSRMGQHDQINDDGIPAILQTHPVSEERISDAENHCENYPKYKEKFDILFPFIQARVVALLTEDPKNELENCQTQLKYPKQKLTVNKSVFLQYLRILLLIKTQNYSEANQAIKSLIHTYPDLLLLKITQVDMLTAAHNDVEALKKIKMLYHDNPDSYPVLLRYGTILVTLKRYQQADSLLENVYLIYRNNETYLDLLSRAQGFDGKKSQAYEDRAQICLIHENVSCAKGQLLMALKFVPNEDERERIQAKLTLLRSR